MSAVVEDPHTIKACCAAAYGSGLVELLVGESFHPGGSALTRRLADLLDLSRNELVIDVAGGNGTSAVLLAAERGVRIRGVDLSPRLVAVARERARDAGVGDRVRFDVGDAERLPMGDAEGDAAICECALCTFPGKDAAAAELARVVRPGGRVGISDVVADRAQLPDELATLLGRVVCIADALSVEGYVALLDGAGLRTEVVERHDNALLDTVEGVSARLAVLAMALSGSVPGFDLQRAKHLVDLAREAVMGGVLGYVVLRARVVGSEVLVDRRAPGVETADGSHALR